MGGVTILVIGDDWRDQLDRYQSIEYAESSNRHIVDIDCLAKAWKGYARATSATFRLPDGSEVADFDAIDRNLLKGGLKLSIVHRPLNGAEPFPEWARKQFGVRVVERGSEPDIDGDHRFGWMRSNDAGEVTELISRDIPGSFFFYFRGSCDAFPLKPGATGWDIREDGTVTEMTAGRAGSARLRDIDFAAIAQGQERLWPHDVIHDGKHIESPDMDELLAGLAPDTRLTMVGAKC